MPISITDNSHSQYYHLNSGAGKFCDALEKPSFYVKKLTNNLFEGNFINLITNLALIAITAPVALAGKCLSSIIYRLKAEKIQASDYDNLKKEWENRLSPLNNNNYFLDDETAAKFIDGCIRHRISASQCPFGQIAMPKKDILYPWADRCPRLFAIDAPLTWPRDEKEIIAQNLLVLNKVSVRGNKTLNDSQGEKGADLSFDERVKVYFRKNPNERDRQLLEHCGFLDFSLETQFDLHYALDVRKLCLAPRP